MTAVTSAPGSTRIPKEVLTEELLEEIKTRCCFVGDPAPEAEADLFAADEADAMDVEDAAYDEASDLALLRRMERRYAHFATAKTISLRIPSLSGQVAASGVGKGWLQIPGWVRERAAEVLFEQGTEDERSVTEVILEALLRVSVALLSHRSKPALTLGLASSRRTCADHSRPRFSSSAAQRCCRAFSDDFVLSCSRRSLLHTLHHPRPPYRPQNATAPRATTSSRRDCPSCARRRTLRR